MINIFIIYVLFSFIICIWEVSFHLSIFLHIFICRKDAGVSFSDSKSTIVDSNQSTVTFCKISNITPLSGTNVTYSTEQIPIDNIEDQSLESWLAMGGANRNHDVLIELHMRKVDL